VVSLRHFVKRKGWTFLELRANHGKCVRKAKVWALESRVDYALSISELLEVDIALAYHGLFIEHAHEARILRFRNRLVILRGFHVLIRRFDYFVDLLEKLLLTLLELRNLLWVWCLGLFLCPESTLHGVELSFEAMDGDS